jgi:signal transduction histidine kinase
LVAIGDAFRYLMLGINRPEQWTARVEWTLAGLLTCFLLLMVTEPWLSRRSKRYTKAYLVVQIIIVSILSLLTPRVDYFAALFMTLILQAMYVFSVRTSLRWTLVLAAVMAILMLYGHPFGEGLPLVVIMSMVYLFIFSYGAVTAEAEQAQRESQRFLTELQEANQQLQEYADRVEELAVEKERGRLARDLHDSVTQSLFSLTLFAQAALERAEFGDLDGAKQSLARIADTARRGLKEMRLLVYELRPLGLEDEGLVGALQQRLERVEGRSGVQTRLLVEPDGEVNLASAMEKELYRIAQEALNNTLKHANASSVTVRLALTPAALETEGRHLVFEVSDDGCGFDPRMVQAKGGLGLMSIRERVEGMGGELNIVSSPVKGTVLRVDVHLSDTEKML